MPAVPLRIRLTLVAAFDGQIGLTAYHISTRTGIARNASADNLAIIAEHYADFLTPDYLQCLGPDAQFLGLRVRYEGPTPASDVEVKDNSTADIGAWPDAGMAPTQLCGLVRKRALESGRRGRGRMFIPFMGLTALDTNARPTAIYLSTLTQLANLVVQPRTITIDTVPTIFDPTLFSANRALPGFTIIATDRSGLLATQRRRGAFGKANPPTL